MTRDELRERVLNIVDAVAGGAEVTIQNGHPRNHKLTDGATDAILALIDQAHGVPLEPSEEALDRAWRAWLDYDPAKQNEWNTKEVLRRAVCAAFRQDARPVSVTGTALDWKRPQDHDHSWSAKTPFGIYRVRGLSGGWMAYDFSGKIIASGGLLEDLKAACQAHFNQRAASIAEVSHD